MHFVQFEVNTLNNGNMGAYKTKLEAMLTELESISISRDEEVHVYHNSMKLLCVANAVLAGMIMEREPLNNNARNGDFLHLYACLQPSNCSPSLVLISGLQLILEDAMKRIYNSINMNGGNKEDPRFRHYPIIHLLTSLNPDHATALVPFTSLRLPEDVHYNMQKMLRAAQMDIMPNTKTPDEIYYLYNSFDRGSYMEFIKLYVGKIIKLIELQKQ